MKQKNNFTKYLFFSRYLFFGQAISVLFFSSCITQRNVEYLRGDDDEIQTYNEVLIEDYQLQPKDELYIQISSQDDPGAKLFSATGSEQFVNIGTIQPYGASLSSYTVDKNGFIQLPVIGLIPVKDKTTVEVSEIITKTLKKILSQPMVSVKLVNRYVTVLGEVLRPGHYNYSQDKVTIYDAIGLAGDITDYGNRDKVILIRNENGKNIRIPVDLTQGDILASSSLYIRPNDIIYVKPLQKKFWALRQFPYDVLLSTITAAILLYSVVK